MKRHRKIVPRTPIFLGCEGESERGYGALLSRYVRELDEIHIHIYLEVLQPGAGNPHALVQKAVQKIAELERRRERFSCKAVLLDLGQPAANTAAQQLATQSGIDHLVWQRPDHEGFLLRHLDGCLQLRPPAGTSLTALRQRWPNYQKGTTQLQLAERIDLARIIEVCSVEPELKAFLKKIGVILQAAE